MAATMIAFTGQFTEAVRMSSILTEHGFHPHPIQPNMQVTHTGGETGFRITVPAAEAKDAAAVLAQHRLEKWLCR